MRQRKDLEGASSEASFRLSRHFPLLLARTAAWTHDLRLRCHQQSPQVIRSSRRRTRPPPAPLPTPPPKRQAFRQHCLCAARAWSPEADSVKLYINCSLSALVSWSSEPNIVSSTTTAAKLGLEDSSGDRNPFRQSSSRSEESVASYFVTLPPTACGSSKPMRIVSVVTCCSRTTCFILILSASASNAKILCSSNAFACLSFSPANISRNYVRNASARRRNSSMAPFLTSIPWCCS